MYQTFIFSFAHKSRKSQNLKPMRILVPNVHFWVEGASHNLKPMRILVPNVHFWVAGESQNLKPMRILVPNAHFHCCIHSCTFQPCTNPCLACFQNFEPTGILVPSAIASFRHGKPRQAGTPGKHLTTTLRYLSAHYLCACSARSTRSAPE